MAWTTTLTRFAATIARQADAAARSAVLDRAAHRLEADLDPLGRQVQRVGDRLRDGWLDARHTRTRAGAAAEGALLDAWRRLDLTGLADRGRDDRA